MSDTHITDRILAADGCHIASRAQGEGDGLPVLFCNSLAADLTMWDAVADGLSGRRVLRYDSRGHGHSDIPNGPYTVEMLARDALAVLDHYGVEKAVICGLSLGGLIAGWLAANEPSRVAGIVLANTAKAFRPASMWIERAGQARAQGMEQFVAPTLERWLTGAFRETEPQATSTVAAMVAATPAEGYAGSCEVLAAADNTDALRAVQCPTLVIVGEQDPSTTVAQGQEIVDLVAGATLVSINAAHLSAFEQPEPFRQALENFIGQVNK